MGSVDSFGAKSTLRSAAPTTRSSASTRSPGHEKLPFSLKVLLENLLRTEDGANVTEGADRGARLVGCRRPSPTPRSSSRRPASIMQDFTGVPCIVDLATMREAVAALGGDPTKINPLAPAEMVIDHSVIADLFGTENALERNVEIEYERNGERYQFLRWGQTAFDDFKVVPPGHRHRAPGQHRVPGRRSSTTATVGGVLRAYPDTCVGTDSHTTMVNGLGVLGWGVGGIEAEAAMLGQPVSMLIPQGRRLQAHRRDPDRRHRDRCRAHDHRDAAQARRRRQVRRVLRRGRRRGAARQPRHHRQHEPRVRLDRRDVPDRRRHRSTTCASPAAASEQVALVEAYAKLQTLWHDAVATSRSSASTSSSTSRPSSRRSPARSARRTASCSPNAKDQFESDLADYADGRPRPGRPRGLRVVPGIRPARQLARGRAQRTHQHHHHSHAPATASKPTPVDARRRRRSSRSTTAPSRSPRSPRAPTPRTRRSCSPPACSPATRSRRA